VAAVIELSIDDRQTQSCSKLTHFEAPNAGFNHPLISQNASHVATFTPLPTVKDKLIIVPQHLEVVS
jgi:hypothetical protein